jgi:hypothetical protein
MKLPLCLQRGIPKRKPPRVSRGAEGLPTVLVASLPSMCSGTEVYALGRMHKQVEATHTARVSAFHPY